MICGTVLNERHVWQQDISSGCWAFCQWKNLSGQSVGGKSTRSLCSSDGRKMRMPHPFILWWLQIKKGGVVGKSHNPPNVSVRKAGFAQLPHLAGREMEPQRCYMLSRNMTIPSPYSRWRTSGEHRVTQTVGIRNKTAESVLCLLLVSFKMV